MKEKLAEKDSVIEHFDQMSQTGKWSSLYSKWDGFTYHFQVRRDRVLELLPQKLGDVLDVGCGPGVMVEAVLERGGNFLGIDISPEMVKEGEEKFGHLPNVKFALGNVESLDFPDNSFDQVICMAVVEYLNTPDLMLAEIHRVLKPGGTTIITVPKKFHIDSLTIGLTKPFRKLAKLFVASDTDSLPRLRMQPAELDKAAEKTGLKFIGGRQYQFTVIPYPLTRIAPDLCMKLNLPLEKFTETRNSVMSYLGHGYIGSYQKV